MAGSPKCDDQIYDAIVKHWTVYKQPPTIQYIVDNTDIQSKSNAWKALFRLCDQGLMRIIKGKAIPAGLNIEIKEKI